MFYNLLNKLIAFLYHVLTKDVVANQFTLPKADKPTIYVVRCSESWQDAMALKSVIQKPLTFVADADRMTYQPVRLFFRLMRALPVYHFDKTGNKFFIEKNQRSLDQCRDILVNNGAIVVFRPAKSHTKALKYARKISARIAYNAEEVFDFKLDVQVVPVIFKYDLLNSSRKITLVFKSAIAVKNFEEIHKQSTSRAIRKLTQQINVSLELIKLKNHSSVPPVVAPSCVFV